jgi:hypothetical protein
MASNQWANPWLGTVSLDSAALDVVARMQAPHEAFWNRAFGNDPHYWRSASPIYRLTARPKPILLVCSSLRPNSCEQSNSFAKAANAVNGQVSVLPVKLRHGEINSNLGLPGKYTDDVESFIKTLAWP